MVAVYARDDEAARALSREPVWARGPSNMILKAELRDEPAVARLADRVGEVDVLVNNVGSYRRIEFAGLTETAWREATDTNLTVAHTVTRHLLPHMKAGGAVVNIGVAMALRGMPSHGHYTAAKAGLIGLTRSLSKELGPRGIRVNTVAPGMIHPAPDGRLRSLTSLARFGAPAEIASVVLFLVSDLSGYITGTTINVDGGI